MWTDRDKERFYEALKQAVICGATPEDIIKEVKIGYFQALDDIKGAAIYSFGLLLK